MNFRIGNGYDVHRLAPDLPLWLGGILVPHNKGCIAHSDGDVLIHAVCDALLGAAGLRDIGVYFPDNDPSLKGVDSKLLLRRVMEKIKEEGYTVGNIDSVIALQQPKIKDQIPEMIRTLATVMEVDEKIVSIKATTTEKTWICWERRGN